MTASLRENLDNQKWTILDDGNEDAGISRPIRRKGATLVVRVSVRLSEVVI